MRRSLRRDLPAPLPHTPLPRAHHPVHPQLFGRTPVSSPPPSPPSPPRPSPFLPEIHQRHPSPCDLQLLRRSGQVCVSSGYLWSSMGHSAKMLSLEQSREGGGRDSAGGAHLVSPGGRPWPPPPFTCPDFREEGRGGNTGEERERERIPGRWPPARPLSWRRPRENPGSAESHRRTKSLRQEFPLGPGSRMLAGTGPLEGEEESGGSGPRLPAHRLLWAKVSPLLGTRAFLVLQGPQQGNLSPKRSSPKKFYPE